MKFTLLVANAVGGLVGDDTGHVSFLDKADLQEVELHRPVPTGLGGLGIILDDSRHLAYHVFEHAPAGLKVKAGFDPVTNCWYVPNLPKSRGLNMKDRVPRDDLIHRCQSA